MQRMLGVPLPNVPQRQLSTVEQNRVLLGILQYRPQHGVSRQVWATTLVEYRHDAMTFMEELNVFFGENFDEDPIWNGVLARPIGGVFNLSSASARRDAYEWAQNAYSAWTPATAENPINYAIFDVGPGALEDRVQAKEMLDNLTVLGHEATGGCLEFSVVSSVFGIYLLAHITGLHNHLDRHMARIGLQANPLWSLRFEFIRPQNDREIMQRQVMRVEYGWHGEAPQRQVHIDPDLEQALLAEVEDLRQVRMLDVEVAAEAQLDETRRRMDLIDGLVRLTLEERQQQNEGFGRRLRELAREPRAQEAAFSAEAENEAIAAQDIAPARAEEAAPRHRRSPSAEQSLEPWVQPWDELTRAMPDSQVPQSTPEDSPNAGRDFGAGL